MSDGQEILNELEFKQKIDALPSDELLKFVAEQTYHNCIDLKEIRAEIKEIVPTKKSLGISGSIGGMIAAAIVSIVDYFVRSNHV